MKNNQLKVTQVNTRFVVETSNGKIHVLSHESLKWNLKHVFGLTGVDLLSVFVCLDLPGNESVIVDLKVA